MNIPFVDLKIQYKVLKKDIDNAIQSVINKADFINGEATRLFERNFAEKYDVKHCIGVANGTDAIYIALKMLGIEKGDEVILPANSWVSSCEAVVQTGATPVFVDVDKYFNIDITKIEEKINEKTIALLPVHLFGQPCKISEIKEIADKYNLYLIEDCAQAHFSKYDGQKVGTFGDAGTFSFYPGKNMGAYGDAGAIITNDDDLAEKVRMFANHGALVKHKHKIEGINSRLDTIQAAILNVKLKYIDQWNEMRLRNAQYYNEILKDIGNIKTPEIIENTTHIFHVYAIRTEHRDALAEFLKENGIQTAIHYPTAIPFMEAYTHLNYKPSDLPMSYKFQDEILSLPMYPELKLEMMNYIATMIKTFFETQSSTKS